MRLLVDPCPFLGLRHYLVKRDDQAERPGAWAGRNLHQAGLFILYSDISGIHLP